MVSKQRPKMGLHRDELEENEEAEEAEEAEEKKKKKKKKKQASTASILHGSSEPVIANHIQVLSEVSLISLLTLSDSLTFSD